MSGDIRRGVDAQRHEFDTEVVEADSQDAPWDDMLNVEDLHFCAAKDGNAAGGFFRKPWVNKRVALEFGVDKWSLLKQKQIFLGLDAIFCRKLKSNRLFTTFPGLNERVVYFFLGGVGVVEVAFMTPS